jgi:hypothetical protein
MKSKITLLIIFVAFIISVIAGLYIYRQNRSLFVESARPSLENSKDGKISTAITYIDFYFNKNIDESQIKRNNIFSNKEIISSTEVRGKIIRVNIKNIEKDIKYIIYLENIVSDDGFILKSYTYSATGFYTNDYSATKEQQDEQNNETDRNNNSDPIFGAVPYQTINYSITADGSITNSSTPTTIKIFVYLASADYTDTNTQKIVDTKIKEAKDYLVSKGIKLDNYKFEYSQSPDNNL